MTATERINPPGLAPPPGNRFAHVVRSGNLVWVAGQTARGVGGDIVGRNDCAAQCRQVYSNLETAMASVGGTLANIVKVTIFLTSEEDLGSARVAQNECWGGMPLPASTMVIVKALANPEYLVEIEAFAVVD